MGKKSLWRKEAFKIKNCQFKLQTSLLIALCWPSCFSTLKEICRGETVLPHLLCCRTGIAVHSHPFALFKCNCVHFTAVKRIRVVSKYEPLPSAIIAVFQHQFSQNLSFCWNMMKWEKAKPRQVHPRIPRQKTNSHNVSEVGCDFKCTQCNIIYRCDLHESGCHLESLLPLIFETASLYFHFFMFMFETECLRQPWWSHPSN